jgi:hypothetical protein
MDENDLRNDVRDLQVSNAKLGVEVGHLAATVSDLKEVVKELNNALNRGRGALWGISTVAAVLGGAAAVAAQKLLGVH